MFRTAWRAGDRDPKGARRDIAADLVFLGTAFRALVRRESLPGWLRAMAAGAGLLRGGAYAAGFWRLRVFSALHTWGNKAAGGALLAFPVLGRLLGVPLAGTLTAGICLVSAGEELILTLGSPALDWDCRGLWGITGPGPGCPPGQAPAGGPYSGRRPRFWRRFR